MLERAVLNAEDDGIDGPERVTDAAGPVDGFDEYVDGASARLLRLAYLLEGVLPDAEDLVQETLLRTLRAWPRVRAADDVDRYVSRIMINLHRSRLRRVRLAAARAGEGGRVAAEDGLAAVEDRWDLARALGSLPQRQRDVVVLRYFADQSEETVAELLGCSVGSVKRQAARAK